MDSLKFGQIFRKRGSFKGKMSRSSDGHFVVVLGIESKTNHVLYQTLESGINKVLHFPNENKPPRVDVDTVSFIDYRKYPNLLHIDTCIMMFYGVDRENVSVFLSDKYKKCGMLSNHNKKALIISLIPARNYRLSVYDSKVIIDAYSKS